MFELKCPFDIFGSRHPFQIIRHIVQIIAVYMVDLSAKQIRDWAK